MIPAYPRCRRRSCHRSRSAATPPSPRTRISPRTAISVSPCFRLSGTNGNASPSCPVVASVLDEGYSEQVRTSIFLDVGNVFDTTYDKDRYSHCVGGCNRVYDMSDPSLYRASYGVTLQWLSPMGPLAVTFAKTLKDRPGDETEMFSFSIGKTF